jgi:hypothetical protein
MYVTGTSDGENDMGGACCGDDVRERGIAVMEEIWNRSF